MFGSERDHRIEARERRVVTFQRREHHAAVDERFDVVGLDRDGAVETGERLIEPIQLVQQAGAVVERVRGVRIHIGRLADQALGLFEPPRLVADDAERVQRIEMARLLAQNLRVDLGGLVEPARPLQAQRALEQRLAHARWPPRLRFDREALRWLAALMTLPHSGVGPLQVTGEPGRVEQRMRVAMARDLCFERRGFLRIAREGERDLLIVSERLRNQLRHAMGLERARRDASGERGARARHERNAREQRVAGRCVRVVRQRVEKQIRQSQPRQVIFDRCRKGREHQTLSGHSPRLGFAFEILHRGRRAHRKPQHAAIDRAQKAHPDVEQIRCELVALIEGAEHKAGFGQSGLASRRSAAPSSAGRHHWADSSPADRRPVSAKWRWCWSFEHEPVRDDVVDIIRAHGSRKAEIVHLYGRRTERKNPRPAVLGKAHQIDRDVDVHVLR